MRELKFRAIDWSFKRKWVYGHYFNGCVYPNSESRDYIYSQDLKNAWGNIEIDKPTIGQFTGLKDKNGKEIYEGDILSTESGICSVIWSDAAFALLSPGSESVDWERSSVYEKSEIIGNIHENPELL